MHNNNNQKCEMCTIFPKLISSSNYNYNLVKLLSPHLCGSKYFYLTSDMSNFVLSFYFLCIDKGHASPKIGFECWAGRKNYATHQNQNQDQVNPPIDNGSKPPTSNKSKQAVLIEKPMRKYPTSKSKQTVLIEKPMRKYQTYRNCTPLR